MTERLHFHFSLSCIGEGNGNPLQCSCLENPRDGGARWAAVCGVAQSRTRLKRRSSSSSSSSSVYAQSLSRVILFATPCTVARKAPLSMGFLRREYQSVLSFPPPGDLPNPGIKPVSPVSPALQAILYHWAIWEAHGGVYMPTLISRSSHPLSLLLCPQVHSRHLHLYSCPSDRSNSTIFCSPWGCKESDTTWWLNNNTAGSHHVQ